LNKSLKKQEREKRIKDIHACGVNIIKEKGLRREGEREEKKK
jgi:hypothetical protein